MSQAMPSLDHGNQPQILFNAIPDGEARATIHFTNSDARDRFLTVAAEPATRDLIEAGKFAIGREVPGGEHGQYDMMVGTQRRDKSGNPAEFPVTVRHYEHRDPRSKAALSNFIMSHLGLKSEI